MTSDGGFQMSQNSRQHRRVDALLGGEFGEAQWSTPHNRREDFTLARRQTSVGVSQAKGAPKTTDDFPQSFGGFHSGSGGFCLNEVGGHATILAIVACWQASNFETGPRLSSSRVLLHVKSPGERPDGGSSQWTCIQPQDRSDHTRSKRSRFITLFHAATKSFTNFNCASLDAYTSAIARS